MKTTIKFKIAGFCALSIGITLIALSVTVLGEDWGELGTIPEMWALVPGILNVFTSIPLLLIGFNPSIVKAGAKIRSETIKHAGEEVGDAASKTADVYNPTITKVAGAVKKGLTDPQVYCKHCGKSIDADSKFCKHCAKEQ